MSLSIRTYDNLEELGELRPAWDDLLSAYPLATTFSTWEWLSCWWRCFGQRRTLLVIAMFHSSSLVGLAPLSIATEQLGIPLRVLRLMGDGSNDSDNLDIPVRPGFDKIFAEAIVRHLQQHGTGWDVCRFDTSPANSLVATCLAEALHTPSWTVYEYQSKCSTIPLPESWELYVNSLSDEDRNNLNRYHRRLQRRHSIRIARSTDADLPASLEALFSLHQERWQSAGEPGSFASEERREFYFQLGQCLLSRGWLELWRLELDGKIAAVQFAFRYRNTVFQLQEGYDHSRSSDRLGFILRGEVLKHLIAEGVRTYDFLGGKSPYKARWGAREGFYRQLHFANSFSLGGLCLRSLHSAGATKEWLRGRLPDSIWGLLQQAHVSLRKKPATLSRAL